MWTSVLLVPVLLFLIATRSGRPSPSQSEIAKSNVSSVSCSAVPVYKMNRCNRTLRSSGPTICPKWPGGSAVTSCVACAAYQNDGVVHGLTVDPRIEVGLIGWSHGEYPVVDLRRPAVAQQPDVSLWERPVGGRGRDPVVGTGHDVVGFAARGVLYTPMALASWVPRPWGGLI
jgi:hypothetical protein